MNSTAVVAGLFGALIGGSACYAVIKRDWWAVSGVLSIGSACLVGTVTEGNQSRGEHNIVFVITMALLLNFAVAFGARQREAQRRRRQKAGPRKLDGDIWHE